MAANHTPGPWHQADAHGRIATGTCIQADGDNYLVASCTGYYGREGAVANARLMAAAPERLDALKASRQEIRALVAAAGAGVYTAGALAAADAAIAKATGEA